MAKSAPELKQDLLLAARQYGIATTLFRHAVGARLGVGVTDMECLGLLFFKGISTPTELARYTGLTSGATTAMLNRLEAAGLITRRPNPHDRRGVLIAVEPASAERLGPLFKPLRTAQNDLLDGYTVAELELLAAFFGRLTDIWELGRQNLPK